MESDLARALVDLDEGRVLELCRDALAGGDDPNSILTQCRGAMQIIGDRFEKGDYFLLELIVSGKIFQKVTDLLTPLLTGESVPVLGSVVIGTPKGDLHDIGKNIVASMLTGAGFKVRDLGVNVPVHRFVEAVEEDRPDIVGLSALLTTTFGAMKEVIDAVRGTEHGARAKIIVGGGPVNERVMELVGADAYGKDAVAAIEISRAIVGRASVDR